MPRLAAVFENTDKAEQSVRELSTMGISDVSLGFASAAQLPEDFAGRGLLVKVEATSAEEVAVRETLSRCGGQLLEPSVQV